MFEYLRYYLSPVMLLFGIVGLYLGGGYVWLGLATLPLLALGDYLLPPDYAKRKAMRFHLAFIPVLITSLFAFVIFCQLAWRVGQGDMSAFNITGAILSTGWIATIVGIPAFHELFHQRHLLYRTLGQCLQVMYLDPTRDIGHVSGHHIDVDTIFDHDTARRGQGLYAFGVEAAYNNFMSAVRMESDMLEKRGQGRWSIHHRIWKALAGLALFFGLMFVIGGWAGMLAAFTGTVIARFLLESFNYFQHYGQVKVPGTPIEKYHVWNHFGALSRAMAFEITNHAQHHTNSYVPFYELTPDTTAVKLPGVFTCFMAALVPPVWHRMVIMPALKEWDLTKASAQERELARAANLKAGWPDWFTESDSAGRSGIAGSAA